MNYVGSAGVMGWPVAHSRSPILHRFWLEALGLDGDYGRFPVAPAMLDKAVRAIPALGLAGVNVTVPHKQAVMAMLDHIDPAAAAIGAVNTIVVEDGRLAGYNTDAPGFAEPLGSRQFDRVLVIGAGGAARAVLAALKARGVGRLSVFNRNIDKARALLAEFGIAGEVAALDTTPPEVDLLVNTSTLGMAGQPALPAGLVDAVADDGIVYDIVYSPLDTDLLIEARARGLVTIDGLAMLIGQAREAFRRFYGAEPPRTRDEELRARLMA